MNQRADITPADRQVGQDVLAFRPVAPRVVRGELERPPEAAGGHVPREDGRCPFVVARPEQGVPRRGCPGAVVDELQARVPGECPVGGATTALPSGTRPGRHAKIARRVGRVPAVGRPRQQQVGVRPGGIRPPEQLPVLGAIPAQVPADAVLRAGHADDHDITNHHWRRLNRAALARVGVADPPDLATGLGIQRRQIPGGDRHEHHAVRVPCQAAGAAVPEAGQRGGTGHGRRVTPSDRAGLVEADGHDPVGVRGVQVHRGAHHERCTLVRAGHFGAEAPGHLELPDSGGGNLVERTVPCAGRVERCRGPAATRLRRPSLLS